MAIPLLLQVGAVPFVVGQDSLAARRQQQRQQNTVTLTSHQRAVIGELMSEAAQAIKDVLRQPQTASICINTDLTVPPNTPASASSTAFEFPDPPSMTSSSSDEEGATPKRPQRKLKRKRAQSFKKHRVAPKKQTSEEADDEATDNEDNLEELKLKLDLISESRSDSEAEEVDDAKKWAIVGEELRFIADRFGNPEDSTEIDFNNPFKVSDLVSIINLMLPVSVPQSLWSALLSYAAWKIFKKFQ